MIKVNYRALGMLSTNCYVVENPDSQKVLIVDPGDSQLEIERQIDEIDGDPEAILLTHGHFDHMLAADALRKKYHIPVYVHEKEQHLLGDPKENLSGLWSKPYTMQADKTVKEGDVLHLADFETQNMWTFIMLDTYTGKNWQVRLRDSGNYRSQGRKNQRLRNH